jgi:hypothetical protein
MTGTRVVGSNLLIGFEGYTFEPRSSPAAKPLDMGLVMDAQTSMGKAHLESVCISRVCIQGLSES